MINLKERKIGQNLQVSKELRANFGILCYPKSLELGISGIARGISISTRLAYNIRSAFCSLSVCLCMFACDSYKLVSYGCCCCFCCCFCCCCCCGKRSSGGASAPPWRNVCHNCRYLWESSESAPNFKLSGWVAVRVCVYVCVCLCLSFVL